MALRLCGFKPDSMLISVVLLLNMLTCQWGLCNLLHMTASSPLTSLPSNATPAPGAGTVLHGVPVVAGVQYGPVIRPGRLPGLDDVDAAPEIEEEDRPAAAAGCPAAAKPGAARPRA